MRVYVNVSPGETFLLTDSECPVPWDSRATSLVVRVERQPTEEMKSSQNDPGIGPWRNQILVMKPLARVKQSLAVSDYRRGLLKNLQCSLKLSKGHQFK